MKTDKVKMNGDFIERTRLAVERLPEGTISGLFGLEARFDSQGITTIYPQSLDDTLIVKVPSKARDVISTCGHLRFYFSDNLYHICYRR